MSIGRWLKFNLVGAFGTAVQLGMLVLLKSVLHMNYLLATALAVEISVLHNFVWHERYTWPDRALVGWRGRLRSLAAFHLTNGLVSIVGNVLLMRLFVGQLRIPYFVANVRGDWDVRAGELRAGGSHGLRLSPLMNADER